MRIVRCCFATLLFVIPTLVAANETIVARVGEDVRYLASDELEGRGVQTKGIRKAAEYIRTEFKRLGLKSGVKDGSYFQKFPVPLRDKPPKMDRNVLVLRGADGKALELKSGKTYQPLRFGGPGKAKSELVFAGYGISAAKQKYDDYKNADVKGKIVVIIRREPQQADADSVFDGKKVTSHSYMLSKINLAKNKGAAGVLLVNDPHSANTPAKDALVGIRQFSTRPDGRAKLPFAQLKISALDQILKQSPVVDANGKKLSSVAEIERNINENMKPLTQTN